MKPYTYINGMKFNLAPEWQTKKERLPRKLKKKIKNGTAAAAS